MRGVYQEEKELKGKEKSRTQEEEEKKRRL